MKSQNKEKRYDVLIVGVDDNKIAAIIGRNLTEEKANTRLEAGLARINQHYFSTMVPTGKCEVAGIYKPGRKT